MLRLFRNTRHITFALSVAMMSFSLLAASAWAGETKDFVEKLKAHYQATRAINKFSLNYHFFNKQYRSQNFWNYQAPDRVLSVRMLEVDMVKKHFYDNDILYAPGGHIRDRVQFQNDTESYYYERNGNVLGKQFLNRGMGNFDRVLSYIVMDIDFLAVRPLLDETNIDGNISLTHDSQSNTTTLTHTISDNSIIDYQFSNAPLRLLKVNNKSKQAIHIYGDYQTTRGLTFARSVNKYYNGDPVPAYISFNDKFDIIEQVDASKLKLPEGYGPEIKRGDGVLTATEIAKDLFLVTDASAWRNSLFKVNGDKIMVFGASGSPAQAKKTIALIREQFPEKTIAAIHVTHPQTPDIAGLNVYAEQGIEILADNYTIAGIKAFPRFANHIDSFKFRALEHEQVIDGASFYILESMHAKRQSFVYFKENEIIFQANFLNIAFDNTIPKVIPNYTRTFIDFVRSKQLKLKRIVGNYKNNNISVEVMNKTYNAMM